VDVDAVVAVPVFFLRGIFDKNCRAFDFFDCCKEEEEAVLCNFFGVDSLPLLLLPLLLLLPPLLEPCFVDRYIGILVLLLLLLLLLLLFCGLLLFELLLLLVASSLLTVTILDELATCCCCPLLLLLFGI